MSAPRARSTYLSWADGFRQIASILNNTIAGNLDNTGTVTLTVSVTTTTVTDPRATNDSVIALTATTANAAAEIGNGTIYISSTTTGQFVITHANNAVADRTYTYTVTG